MAGDPLVIAHRGASAHRPEHTLVGYRLAVEQGADFIEPDLVVTRDGILIARHDVLLAQVQLDEAGGIVRDSDGRLQFVEATTDVAAHPEYGARLTVRELDGEQAGGWFADDFTLREIRTLRARERLPAVRPDNLRWADELIPTFAEVMQLAHEGGVGIYPELKHPTYFAERGHDLAALLVAELRRGGFDNPPRVFIQCFEIEALLRMKELAPELPRIQLLGDIEGGMGSFSTPWDVTFHARRGDDLVAIYGDFAAGGRFAEGTGYDVLTTDAGLAFIATYATGIGPWIRSLDVLGGGVAWLARAKGEAMLQVHPYTVRPEDRFRMKRGDGTTVGYEEELRLLRDLGVDGFFVEDSARARAALKP
jgi:glycerophosphoryl diester phosphodiesterase